MCTKTKDISCKLDVCKTTNSNISFEIDFQNNELKYFTKYDLKYKILDKRFHSQDSIYKKPVNTLSLNGFTIQLFNFEGKKSYGKPEFISVQTQTGLIPETESDITTTTSFSKCYPK
jgi:hypothetical protein